MTDLSILLTPGEVQPAFPQPSSNTNPALLYLANLGSPRSRRTMRAALDTIAQLDNSTLHNAETFPWSSLRYQHTSYIRALLKERYKYSTANKMLSALRGVLKAARRLGLMTADDYTAASDISNIKGHTEPTGRDLKGGELHALVRVCKDDPTPAGTRDAAIIAILYICGLRRSELASLQLSDYDPSTGKITVHAGKGNKDRTVYIADSAQQTLDNWITVRGNTLGPLFNPISRSGQITACIWQQPDDNTLNTGRWISGTITDQAIYLILQKRREQAGIAPFTPHDLRRTFVGDLLDAGADINTVSKLAGHSDINTTAKYDRRKEETKKKAASLLHFPS